MSLKCLWNWIGRPARGSAAARRHALRVQTLEERSVPAIFAVGSGPGIDATVKVFDDNGVSVASFKPYPLENGTFFQGGVSVAVGDVNGDTVPDVITGAGPGGGPHVKVFNGVDIAAGSSNPGVLMERFAFEATFRGGVNVAGGDVNGDGKADIVAGAGPGGGPKVSVFSGTNINTALMTFFAFESTFAGGVSVGAGDLGGDQLTDEIVVGAGPGGGPKINGWNFVAGSPNEFVAAQKLTEFFAFDSSLRGGVFVASAPVTDNRDSSGFLYSDIIAGMGQGRGFGDSGQPRYDAQFKVFRLLDALNDSQGNPNWQYFQAGASAAPSNGGSAPYYSTFAGGVSVGAVAHGSVGLSDIVVAPFSNGGPDIRIYNQTSIGDVVLYSPVQRAALAFPFDASFIGGLRVSG